MKRMYRNVADDEAVRQEVLVKPVEIVEVVQPKEIQTEEELRVQAKTLIEYSNEEEARAKLLEAKIKDLQAEVKDLKESSKARKDRAAELLALAEERDMVVARKVKEAQEETPETEKKPKARKAKGEVDWCPEDLVGRQLAGEYANYTGEKRFYLAKEDGKYWPFFEPKDAAAHDPKYVWTPLYWVENGYVVRLLSAAEESEINFKN